MAATVERVLADNPRARLIVDGISWSSEDLLRAGEQLADYISRKFNGLQILTISSANGALITVAITACSHLRVPVLLLDPDATSTGFGAAEDVLISDRQFPDCGPSVTVDERLECYLARRASGGSCSLPSDAILFQTSGSTAAPRAVVKSAAAVLRDSARIADYLHGDIAPAKVVCAAPVFHSYGFTHGLLASLLADGEVVFRRPSSSPSSLARAVVQSGASTLIALPTQIQMIAELRALDFAELKQVVSAGAPIRADAVSRVCQDYDFRLLNVYGASEVGSCTVAALHETSAPGSVGVPLDGVDILIDPADGELLVRNDAFAVGYFADAEIRALPTEDGWYRTGDLAERGEEGLRISGRRGDLINVAGRKTRRSRLECILAEHPDVLEVQVVTAEDEFRGEVPVARVVVRPGHARPDLIDWSRSRLAPFEVPREVEWLDRLPRSATGKLIYAAHATEIEH
ncbi:class I adenylate-forming enzyme family protein [Streptomyces sp. SBT349]|uniref:class I adenylate-forming enzyme family protein n=1 Tax=Streptomyces sp. SBT349 TaxID=1580539 RepID=UPI00099D7C7C|nr:fatty acid--CoA ligase family protein [Streptomyces sp. SBT349]